MTIDELIQDVEETAQSARSMAIESGLDPKNPARVRIYTDIADKYNQIAEHLKELKAFKSGDMGEISDGYHTFNQLYHQRAMLFAVIVNQNKDRAWKSFKHSDGKYCFDSNGEWFIVGVDTDEGSYTYHYEKKYWDIFHCEELEHGKEWDGHTEEDVGRLLTLEQESCIDAVSREDVLNGKVIHYSCDGLEIIYGEAVPVGHIKSLPPVSPQSKPGKWIENHTTCSSCGWKMIDDVTGSVMMVGFKHCPECGTRMEE